MENKFALRTLWTSLLLVLLLASQCGDQVRAAPGMDTDLGDSHASFIGEAAGDESGFAIAGAGDVNGDGFDDILVGAPRGDGTSNNVGRTYLVLGNASGWSMDTDLGDADASFLGEAGGDLSGYSVAGAGDVNGDGYDDILIGAPVNSEAGALAGQTYLFLGGTSGWSWDTVLSSADASFLGESPGDRSGRTVAGAGDVNGDGYDDILIGADYADVGTKMGTGRTYLVLGRPSGWAMDTPLSEANASFLGEEDGDRSGRSIAGAGDVNGDGYDDILIGAYLSDDGGPNSGQAYLILGKASGWTTGTDLSSSSASFWGEEWADYAGRSVAGAGDVDGDGYDDILIGADANSEGGGPGDLMVGQTYLVLGRSSGWSMDTNLSHANASFLGEAGGDVSGFSVAGAGDVDGDGYDDILIGAYGSDAGGSLAGQTYVVRGRAAGWAMDTPLSSADASFLGEGADDQSGRPIAGAGDVNGDGFDDILIGAQYNDEGAADAGQTYLVFYSDGSPPELGPDTTPGTATTGDPLTFSVKVTDNMGLSAVWVEYWYGDIGSHTNVSMDPLPGDLWVHSIVTQPMSLDTLHYLFSAVDNSSNVAVLGPRNITVLDDDPPVLGIDTSATSATTGDAFNVSIDAWDNIGLSKVEVVYQCGGAPSWSRAELIHGQGRTWVGAIAIPRDSLEPLRYRFFAEDGSANSANTTVRTVNVTDNDPPDFLEGFTPTEASTGDEFTFAVELHDNIAPVGAWVEYRHRDGPISNASLIPVPEDTWLADVVLGDDTEDLIYRIGAVDAAGNVNWTIWRIVEVRDNDAPEVVEDLSDTRATTGDVFVARIRVRDNLGILRVSSGKDTWTPTDVDEQGNGVYEHRVTLGHDVVGQWNLRARVADRYTNEMDYEVVTPDIVDNDPPELRSDRTRRGAMKGWSLSFVLDVWENLPLENATVHVEYRLDQGLVQNSSMQCVVVGNEWLCFLIIDVPREADALTYRFTAGDSTGNWNSSEERAVTLYNAGPEVAPIPAWNVTEGTDAELDLSSYITDPNDDTFTLGCTDDEVTVEGHVLGLRHDAWVPDRTVTVTVSDGENSTEATLTIHVVNVNDLPVISWVRFGGQPLDPGSYVVVLREGDTETIQVLATDEDGDPLVYRWLLDDEEVARGAEVGYRDLRRGRHDYVLEVSDPTGSTRLDHITVDVRPREVEGTDTAIYYVILVLGMVVALVALAIVHRRKALD